MIPDFDLYAEYRLRGEDPECTALRLRLPDETARQYETDLRTIRERSTPA
jgi:hypothetical protein